MKFEYLKPVLKDLSQGSRLSFVRQYRHISKNEVAEHFNLGGERMNRTINRYEKNVRAPKEERLVELANLFNVNINSIKEYDFTNPIDTIYALMWLEDEYSFITVDVDTSNIVGSNKNILNGLNKWKNMKSKYINKEISYEEYMDWKLNFKLED